MVAGPAQAAAGRPASAAARHPAAPATGTSAPLRQPQPAIAEGHRHLVPAPRQRWRPPAVQGRHRAARRRGRQRHRQAQRQPDRHRPPASAAIRAAARAAPAAAGEAAAEIQRPARPGPRTPQRHRPATRAGIFAGKLRRHRDQLHPRPGRVGIGMADPHQIRRVGHGEPGGTFTASALPGPGREAVQIADQRHHAAVSLHHPATRLTIPRPKGKPARQEDIPWISR